MPGFFHRLANVWVELQIGKFQAHQLHALRLFKYTIYTCEQYEMQFKHSHLMRDGFYIFYFSKYYFTLFICNLFCKFTQKANNEIDVYGIAH